MKSVSDFSQSVGFALSGGAFRGLAHIGVLKTLYESNITPRFIAGTSVGSLIGAMAAAGKTWRELIDIANSLFWPQLLDGDALERFCARVLPKTFDELTLPFAAVAMDTQTRQPVILRKGDLASAISASCAVPIRKPVIRDGLTLTDGGFACVLPATVCREMGARYVISSDVWGFSWGLRSIGVSPEKFIVGQAYPAHYREALRATDLLIAPHVPLAGVIPGPQSVKRMVLEGEKAARAAMRSEGGQGEDGRYLQENAKRK